MQAVEDDQGKLDSVTEEDVAQVLQDRGVKLAVLAACQSDVGAPEDAYELASRVLDDLRNSRRCSLCWHHLREGRCRLI